MISKAAVILTACLLFSFLLLAAFGVAQQDSAPSPEDSATTIKVDVHLIEVYATIFDQKNRYVDGLQREDFRVYEDGKPQSIADFETNAQDLSCALLLDSTGSMADVLPRVKNAAVRLIDQLGPHDAVAVYTFDQRLVVSQDFTRDKAAAKRAVLRTRAQGQTALFDALAQASQAMTRRSGRKALIVFTDGDDNASALNATSAVNRAKKVGIPLYVIEEGEALRSSNLKKLLADLSQRTGGTSHEVSKLKDMDDVFQGIVEDLQHLYMLAYQPPSAGADGKWHKIDLEVSGLKKYRVRAKEGYFSN